MLFCCYWFVLICVGGGGSCKKKTQKTTIPTCCMCMFQKFIVKYYWCGCKIFVCLSWTITDKKFKKLLFEEVNSNIDEDELKAERQKRKGKGNQKPVAAEPSVPADNKNKNKKKKGKKWWISELWWIYNTGGQVVKDLNLSFKFNCLHPAMVTQFAGWPYIYFCWILSMKFVIVCIYSYVRI